jgi:hypothetical protein
VRPGGLSNDKPRGVAELEINQGDTIIGTQGNECIYIIYIYIYV